MESATSAKEREVAQWLENKLSNIEETWSSRSVASQLAKDRLVHVPACFLDLPAHAKLRLLLSIVHTSRRNLEQWSSELLDILELAVQDTDEWVQVIADLLKDFPSTSRFSFVPNPHSEDYFARAINELRQILKGYPYRAEESGTFCLPLDAIFMNKTALVTVQRNQAQMQPPKLFSLKMKPKSAAVKSELLNKSKKQFIAGKGKSKGVSVPMSSVVPIKPRNMAHKSDNTAPLKGLPTANASKTSGGFGQTKTFSRPMAPKKEGGVKFIEIDETPQAKTLALKQRRKMAENERKQSVQEKKARKAKLSESHLSMEGEPLNTGEDEHGNAGFIMDPSLADHTYGGGDLGTIPGSTVDPSVAGIVSNLVASPGYIAVNPQALGASNSCSNSGTVPISHENIPINVDDPYDKLGKMSSPGVANANHLSAYAPPGSMSLLPSLQQQGNERSSAQITPKVALATTGFYQDQMQPTGGNPLAYAGPGSASSASINVPVTVQQVPGGSSIIYLNPQQMQPQVSGYTAYGSAGSLVYAPAQILQPAGSQPIVISATTGQPVNVLQAQVPRPSDGSAVVQTTSDALGRAAVPAYTYSFGGNDLSAAVQPSLSANPIADNVSQLFNPASQDYPASASQLRGGLAPNANLPSNQPPQQQPLYYGTVQQQLSTPPHQAPAQPVDIQPRPPVMPVSSEKPTLKLSREMILQAQELFKNANKLSRPEKSLILGFMAGKRENPCPQMGQILTIRLNESKESMLGPDGTVQALLTETFFQMNFDNGEWKKLLKKRPLKPGE